MFSLTVGPITGEQIERAIALLTANGLLPGSPSLQTGSAPPVPGRPPAPAATAMPPMPAAPVPTAAPPPPPQPAPAAPANAKLENVLKLMDAYARAGHQVAGARKVLAVLGLSRAQDANEEQLDWLAAAFANTGWAP